MGGYSPAVATKARHLKTPLQLWIADHRKAASLTSADLAAWTGVSVDTARGWESRGRPSEDALSILERRFGQPAPRSETPTDQSAIVAAIDRLREAVERQTEEQGRGMTALAEVLGDLLGRLAGLPGHTPAGSADRGAEVSR
jgi:hypothetical protein